MCGICGIAYADGFRSPDESQLIAMCDALQHRGPDDAGHWIDGGIGLGSRRLAILDLSPRGHMPMTTASARSWIVYNGEIYNHADLRAELVSKGHVFRSRTDTEVLLALYAAEGPSMLSRLNGMFAFAIWDAGSRTLFAARDRLGVKPLYYAEHQRGLFFASEQKALFAAGVPATFDSSTWEELLCFRYVAGDRTPFVGVKRLLPGHCFTFSDGQLRIRRWWHYAERVRERREDLPADHVRWFQETFDSAVAMRRISDVPVGVLLSGGLDSGSVAASLASQAGAGVSSFTVRFDESGFDEGELAAQVASTWSLTRRELKIPPDRLLDRMERASWLNDEPLGHASDIHLGAIAELAKPHVTVLLSGEGADELLGGYVRYEPLRHPTLVRGLRPLLSPLAPYAAIGSRLQKLARFLTLPDMRAFGLFNACEVLPAELHVLGMPVSGRFPYREQVWDAAEQLFPADLARQAMFSDQHTFLCSLLDRNDRMTMGASIECRVPFLDFRLVEGVAALPSSVLFAGRQRKSLLRDAVGHRLPAAVLRGGKWGFGVPWSRYLRTEPSLRQLVQTLPERDPIRNGPFLREGVTRTIDAFLAGDNSNAHIVRQLVMVAAWHAAACGPTARTASPVLDRHAGLVDAALSPQPRWQPT